MSKKEQILEYFKDINVAYNDYTMHDTLEHMLEDLEEVRHGHWILREEPNGIDLHLECSECKEHQCGYNPEYGSKYCPNCGAKMDEHIDTPTDPVAK